MCNTLKELIIELKKENYNYDPQYRQFAFNTCIKLGRLDLVKFFIEVEKNINLNYNSILGDAAEYDQLEIFKYLVKNGANIDYAKNEALTDAVENNNFEFVKYLVEECYANIDEKEDEEAYYYNYYSECSGNYNYTIIIAAESGNIEIVNYLLNRFEFTITEYNNALLLSAENNHKEVVKSIIDSRPEFNNIFKNLLQKIINVNICYSDIFRRVELNNNHRPLNRHLCVLTLDMFF